MNSTFEIRDVRPKDCARITEIYNYFVRNTITTFDLQEWTVADMTENVMGKAKDYPFLVLEEESLVIGYAYAMRWKGRKAYDNTVEVSIYFDSEKTGGGRGKSLYKGLFDRLQEMGIHVVIAGVSLPNDVSVKFHERIGFEKVAHFKEVGHKFDRWIDVAYWQLFLNTNS